MIKIQKEQAVDKLFKLIAISQSIAHVKKHLLDGKEDRDLARIKL